MLVEAGDLAPVHLSPFIRFPVEHVRIDAADGKPAVIDPAPVVFQKPARSLAIVLYFQGIPRNIENTVLVAELGIRSRFERVRIDLPDRGNITVKQEDMAVECPGAAPAAGSAPEAHVPDNTGKAFQRIPGKFLTLCREQCNTGGDRKERNCNHPAFCREKISGPGYCSCGTGADNYKDPVRMI